MLTTDEIIEMRKAPEYFGMRVIVIDHPPLAGTIAILPEWRIEIRVPAGQMPLLDVIEDV